MDREIPGSWDWLREQQQLQLQTDMNRELTHVWQAINELRDWYVDIDHAKAPRSHVQELHSRVDRLEETCRHTPSA